MKTKEVIEMVMKSRSKKNKGIRLQNYVKKKLIETFGFSETEVKPAIMGERGIDIHLSAEALKRFPFSIECKNQERWNVPKFWKQTVENTLNETMPLLVLKKNRSEVLAVMRFEDLLRVMLNEFGKTNRPRGGKVGIENQKSFGIW